MCIRDRISGRSLANLFHGISSPQFPVTIWARNNHVWRKHLDVDWPQLNKIASEELRRNVHMFLWTGKLWRSENNCFPLFAIMLCLTVCTLDKVYSRLPFCHPKFIGETPHDSSPSFMPLHEAAHLLVTHIVPSRGGLRKWTVLIEDSLVVQESYVQLYHVSWISKDAIGAFISPV